MDVPLGRCLSVCWVGMAQVTFQAKAVVLEVLFGGHVQVGRAGRAELGVLGVLFEMGLAGPAVLVVY